MDKRRRFNKSERVALYLAADGKCSDCGNALEPGWHADHIRPWSKHGPTDVVNGQALCPECNLKKGDLVSDLREWQTRALEDMSQWKPMGDNGFLIEATPGAGKTRVAMEAARRAFDAGTIDRVVIAVPSGRLETQWHEEFASLGFNINPDWHASVGVLPADEQGCAATYAEIAKQPAVFRKMVSQGKTLAILDEVHHCADTRSWGEGVGEAFEPARIRVLLSGTPFRSDNHEIPFVNYVDGTGIPDHRYGYAQALDDRVVRPVWFPRCGGKSEWVYKGRERSASFDDVLNKEESNRRLRTAISPNTGGWLVSVLGDADRKLLELREADPTTGGIVFCEDSYGARSVAAILSSMGREVTLAISEEKDSQTLIRDFCDSRTPWLVSIRQVSEGVDIPRLRVGVYATNYLTEMFFRQALGRLVRRREDEADPTAYLFIPDDERLRSMAEAIREARDHVLSRQLDEACDGENGGTDSSGGGEPLFLPIASDMVDRGMIVDADTITPEQFAEAERIKKAADTVDLPTPQVAKLLKSAGHFDVARTAGATPQSARPKPTSKQRKDLLIGNNNITANSIANRLEEKHSKVNGMLNSAVGVATIRQCTEDQLQRRLVLARQWLNDGVAP